MKTRELTLLALLIALTAVATLVIRVPVPQTGGYINMGETMVYTSALLFGPLFGGLAGGIGSALADLIAGFHQFILPTLIIKGLEGFLVGMLAARAFRRARTPAGGAALAVVAIAIGGAVMVLGYFLTQAYVLGLGAATAAAEVPGNIFQVIGGAIVAIPISLALRRAVPHPSM